MTLPRMPDDLPPPWVRVPAGADSITITWAARTPSVDLLRWLEGLTPRTGRLHRALFAAALLYAVAAGVLDHLRRKA